MAQDDEASGAGVPSTTSRARGRTESAMRMMEKTRKEDEEDWMEMKLRAASNLSPAMHTPAHHKPGSSRSSCSRRRVAWVTWANNLDPLTTVMVMTINFVAEKLERLKINQRQPSSPSTIFYHFSTFAPSPPSSSSRESPPSKSPSVAVASRCCCCCCCSRAAAVAGVFSASPIVNLWSSSASSGSS